MPAVSGVMTMRKTMLALTIAAAATLGTASNAMAEAARSFTLGGTTLTANWEGTGSGVVFDQGIADEIGCQPGIHECDDTLIEVTEAGSLTVKTSSTDPKSVDTDLQLFTADANGEVKNELQESAQPMPTPNEQVAARVKPGFYIARIDFTGTPPTSVIQAEAALKPSAPAGGPAAGPDAPPTVTVAKPKSKRVKKFKGTASGDAETVEIGILKLKGKSSCQDVTQSGKRVKHEGECTQPNVFFEANGTTNWTAKLKKNLKRGRYIVFARATDAAGQTQGGYGAANRKAFKVKR